MTDLLLALFFTTIGAVGATAYFILKPSKFERLHAEALEELEKLKGKLP